MGRKTKLGLQVGVVAAIGLLVLLLGWRLVDIERGQHIPSDIAQGKRPAAPDFILPRLDQEGALQLSSLRGKTVIVNFWASWCVPCQDEAPVLQATSEQYKGDDVVVLGIDTEDLSGDARDFIERFRAYLPQRSRCCRPDIDRFRSDRSARDLLRGSAGPPGCPCPRPG